MDVAASEFWVPEKKVYDLDFKVKILIIIKTANNDGSKCLTGDKLMALYESFIDKFPIKSIEDPFD